METARVNRALGPHLVVDAQGRQASPTGTPPSTSSPGGVWHYTHGDGPSKSGLKATRRLVEGDLDFRLSQGPRQLLGSGANLSRHLRAEPSERLDADAHRVLGDLVGPGARHRHLDQRDGGDPSRRAADLS